MQNQISIRLNPNIFGEQNEDFFEPRYWQSRQAIEGQERGRGTTWFVRHNEHSLVLRHYYRGGLMSKLNRDSYVFTTFDNTRAFKEYALLEELFHAGLPVPEPAGARVIRTGHFSYSADLITRRIQDAQDLLQVLQEPANNKLIEQLAETIALLHRHGVWHPDLNIQNLLVDKKGKVWVIDFDQAKRINMKNRYRRRMLERIERSFLKEHVRHSILWTEKNWPTFLDYYHTAYARK